MSEAGEVFEMVSITTWSYKIYAREGTDAWQSFTGKITVPEPKSSEWWQQHIDESFQGMGYNYKLMSWREVYGIDEKGNRHNLEPVQITEDFYELNIKEVRDEGESETE